MRNEQQKNQNARTKTSSPGGQARGERPGKKQRAGENGDRRGKPRGQMRENRSMGPAGAAHKILSELPILEKVLAKGDFSAQKTPLTEILKSLRPLRLKSLDELDFNTKGRLMTSLLRVGRQIKPSEPAHSSPSSVEAPAVDGAAPKEDLTREMVLPEAESTSTAAATVPSASSEAQLRYGAYQDVMFLVGSIWRAVGEERRAALAFAASGREAEQEEAVKTFHRTGNWQEEAIVLEEQKKFREAARLHQKHKQWMDAVRLFESAQDFREAFRCALSAKHEESIRRLTAQLKPDEVEVLLERAGAWEWLMQWFVEQKNFEGMARLYERSKQHDQAGLAWERANKWSHARKAYERARDLKSATRVREIETQKLIERGDRLGAAVLFMSGGDRQRAVEVLSELPGPKAFRFLQKVKLDAEALALARREIDRTMAENKPGQRARWLELLGDHSSAAEAWILAERKDKAMAMYEQVGDWQKAAQLAEALGLLEKAEEWFHRAGDKAAAERVQALPRVPAIVGPAGPAASQLDEDSDA